MNFTADPQAASSLGVASAGELPAFVLSTRGRQAVRFSGSPTSEGLVRASSVPLPLRTRASTHSLMVYTLALLQVSFVESEVEARASPSLVRKLTDSDFDKVAFSGKHHVFVEFYAPWCFHCKRLAHDWEQLARVFETERSVIIAKVDATESRKAPADNKVRGAAIGARCAVRSRMAARLTCGVPRCRIMSTGQGIPNVAVLPGVCEAPASQVRG